MSENFFGVFEMNLFFWNFGNIGVVFNNRGLYFFNGYKRNIYYIFLKNVVLIVRSKEGRIIVDEIWLIGIELFFFLGLN